MDDFFNDKDASDRELNDFGNFSDDDMAQNKDRIDDIEY